MVFGTATRFNRFVAQFATIITNRHVLGRLAARAMAVFVFSFGSKMCRSNDRFRGWLDGWKSHFIEPAERYTASPSFGSIIFQSGFGGSELGGEFESNALGGIEIYEKVKFLIFW